MFSFLTTTFPELASDKLAGPSQNYAFRLFLSASTNIPHTIYFII
jgi:hypothetical protein